MSWLNTETETYFDHFRGCLRDTIRRGAFDEAIDLCDQAIAWGRDRGDQDAVDLGWCNKSGVLITLGRGEEASSRLRRILLSSSNPVCCFVASYNLSRVHEERRETQRGLFYARLSQGHAERAGRSDFLAASHNQVGGLLLIDCYFEEARDSYLRALDFSPPDLDRAIMGSNIGYCQVVLGHQGEGFEWLFRSLRDMRRQGAETWEMLPRLGLSYAYLEIDRPERSRRHAVRALALAESASYREHIMNALFLLGEAEKLLGHEFEAYTHFQRLQRDYYPDAPFISDVLMSTDVRQLVHLMA